MIRHLLYTQIDFKICLNIETDSNWWVHGFKYLIEAQPTNQFMESIFKMFDWFMLRLHWQKRFPPFID